MKKLTGIMEMVCENNKHLTDEPEVIELAKVISRNAFYDGMKAGRKEKFTVQEFEKEYKKYVEEDF